MDAEVRRSPIVFLSHSHRDKRLARRLVRRMSVHGIKVWIDERELRIGAALESSIRAQIRDSDVFLVIASRAAATSRWVALETECALEYEKTIIPVFNDPGFVHERYEDFLGVDASSPQLLSRNLHQMMEDLFRALGGELPPPDPGLLAAGLRELAREQPNLEPLIAGYIDSEGLHRENSETVWSVDFCSLDEALDALFDLSPDSRSVFHAAYGFCERGAGVRALFSWIKLSGDGDTPLVTAVGSRELDSSLIPVAIELLAACRPPNNQALYQFIHHNAAQFDEEARRSVIRLVTWPIRADPGRSGDVMAWVALKHFPDAEEIQRMWTRWILDGAFDGDPCSPVLLADYFVRGPKEGLPWELLNEALRSHLRRHLRSGERGKVLIAMEHIRAAADADAPVLGLLLSEAYGVSSTFEWNRWKERDPETAEKMKWYVHHISNEAAGDRNWLRAMKGVDESMEFDRLRRQVLDEPTAGS